MTEIEPLSASRITARQITDLWTRGQKRFQQSRDRIVYARDVTLGRVGVQLPDDFPVKVTMGDKTEGLSIQLPIRRQLINNQTSVMGGNVVQYRRYPIGDSDQADRDANDLERYTQALMDKITSWDAAVGRAIQDGEWAAETSPATSDWQKAPEFLDATGKPLARYHRDKAGRAADHPSYAGRNRRATTKAYEDELTRYFAHHTPLVHRLISATDCVPFFTEGDDGRPFSLYALLKRKLYTEEQLIKRGYIWSKKGREDKPSGLLSPTDWDQSSSDAYGANGLIYLYSLYCWLDDDPVVAYCVGGSDTRRIEADTLADPIVNLRQEYGLTRLPVTYHWGTHLEVDDPDYRGEPLMYSFASAILIKEALIGATVAHAIDNGFPGIGVSPAPDVPPEAYMEEGGQNLKPFTKPRGGGLVTLPGPVTPLVGPPVGDEVRYLIGTLGAEVDSATPDEGVFGGKGAATSGHQLSLSKDYLKAARRQILDGLLEYRKEHAEIALELITRLVRNEWRQLKNSGKTKLTAPLYVAAEVTPGPRNQANRPKRQLLEFNERWIGSDVFDITAEYSPQGANPIEVQQRADLVEKGLAEPTEVRELLGDQDPSATMARIWAWKWLLETPEGQQEMQIRVAQQRGDQETAQRLIEQGRLTADGAPTAALPPGVAQPPMQPGAGMPPAQPPGGMQPMGQGGQQTTDLPNLAASALGGTIAGGMGTASLIRDARHQLGGQQ